MITKFKLFESDKPDIFDIVQKDDSIELQKYLENGGDPNIRTDNNMFSLLDWIVIHNSYNCARELLEYGVDIDVCAFIDAILEKKTIMIEILYDAVNINDVCEKTHITPLLAATYIKSESLIKRMIDDGAEWIYKAPKNIFIIKKDEDFLDVLKRNSFSIYQNIIEKYPEKYEKYLKEKRIRQFNI